MTASTPTAITEVTVDEYGPLTGACVAMNMGCSRSMPRRLAGTPAPHHQLVCGDASADCRTRLAWASVAALWHGRLAVREPSSPHISVDLLRRRQAAGLPKLRAGVRSVTQPAGTDVLDHRLIVPNR
jgi:hypothetical protein